jgi:hypothetical protein
MLKEYLSTAASLIAESLFGTPAIAQACGEGCTQIGYCYGLCGSCGGDKKTRYKYVHCGLDFSCCLQDCVYC